MQKSLVVVIFCFAVVSVNFAEAKVFPDDDRECKRHNNEVGYCLRSNEHSTCACLFHEKPFFTVSEWHEKEEIRTFTQTCEPLTLPYHEDTCKFLPGNPDDLDEYTFLCPNNGFFQTWGAFAPRKGSHHVRLWYRCCEAECPKWVCQWTPFNEPQGRFEVPMKDAFIAGVRGKHVPEKKDTSWSLKLCVCDRSATVKEEL